MQDGALLSINPFDMVGGLELSFKYEVIASRSLVQIQVTYRLQVTEVSQLLVERQRSKIRC